MKSRAYFPKDVVRKEHSSERVRFPMSERARPKSTTHSPQVHDRRSLAHSKKRRRSEGDLQGQLVRQRTTAVVCSRGRDATLSYPSEREIHSWIRQPERPSNVAYNQRHSRQ